MRATFLVSVIAALVSLASTVSASNSVPQGRVVARDSTRARPPRAVPPGVQHVPRTPDRRNLATRTKPYNNKPQADRRDVSPNTKPSKQPDRRGGLNLAARTKQYKQPDRRDVVPNTKPSKQPDRRDLDLAARTKPSSPDPPSRRDVVPNTKPSKGPDTRRRRDRDHVPRRPSQAEAESRKKDKRAQEEQNVFGSEGNQCPVPLSACPVRGAGDAHAFECVDLWTDLDSCGGCAADNIAYVSLLFSALLSCFLF